MKQNGGLGHEGYWLLEILGMKQSQNIPTSPSKGTNNSAVI